MSSSPVRHARLLIVMLLTLACTLAIQPRAYAFPQEDAPKADDPWNFADEEEEVQTWSQDLKNQAMDLAALVGFFTLTLVGFFKKSERLKWITMGAAVVYLGFARSQLISIVNIFALTHWNLPVFRHNLAWYLFAIFTLVTTILWGRLYCGSICAFGSLTQLLDKIVPAKLRFEIPRRIDQRASYIKYVILGAAVLYFLVTRNILIYRYIEPFWMFSFEASKGMWIGLAVLLTA